MGEIEGYLELGNNDVINVIYFAFALDMLKKKIALDRNMILNYKSKYPFLHTAELQLVYETVVSGKEEFLTVLNRKGTPLEAMGINVLMVRYLNSIVKEQSIFNKTLNKLGV